MTFSNAIGDISYQDADISEVKAITEFVVKCKRVAYHHPAHLVPKGYLDYLDSDVFPQDYLNYRIKSLSKTSTIARVAIDSETKQIVGYIEFGLKSHYFDDFDCKYEILCYFVDPLIIGKGIGTNLLFSVLKRLRDQGTFEVGKDSIGIMTGQNNPFIHTIYKKIGAYPIRDVEHNFGSSPTKAVLLIWDAEHVQSYLQKVETQYNLTT